MKKSKVTIGKDGSTYRIRVAINDTIKYIYPGTKDEIELKKIALQVEQDILKNEFDYSLQRYKFTEEKLIDLSVAQAYDLWISKTKGSLSPNTQKACRGSGNLLKKSNFGNVPLKGFTRQKAYDFLVFCNEQNLKSSSILKRISDYKSCWEWLINLGIIKDNPWIDVKKNIKNNRKTIDPFTKEEVTKILEGFRKEPEYFAFTILVFNWLPNRRGLWAALV